jgi:hypothetical protein
LLKSRVVEIVRQTPILTICADSGAKSNENNFMKEYPDCKPFSGVFSWKTGRKPCFFSVNAHIPPILFCALMRICGFPCGQAGRKELPMTSTTNSPNARRLARDEAERLVMEEVKAVSEERQARSAALRKARLARETRKAKKA